MDPPENETRRIVFSAKCLNKMLFEAFGTYRLVVHVRDAFPLIKKYFEEKTFGEKENLGKLLRLPIRFRITKAEAAELIRKRGK